MKNNESAIIKMAKLMIKIDILEEQLLKYYNEEYNDPNNENTKILISIIERKLDKLTQEHEAIEKRYKASIEEDVRRSMGL